jgi:uncharacterized protein YukE
MATITVNYAALANGHDGLVATWTRIEGLLAELDSYVASTADMTAETLVSYRALKARWDASAEQRQGVLHALATVVGRAGEQYRQVDTAMAAQFG